MANTGIPKNVKEQVSTIVDQFNQEVIADPKIFYYSRYRGKYLYLYRGESKDKASPICRLKYTGKMDKWEFAIYKYSKDRYDPKEWFFPGSGFVDGTIAGALKAGMEAYPMFNTPKLPLLARIFSVFFRGLLFLLDTIFVLIRKKSEYPYPIDINNGSITLPAAIEEELRGLIAREKKTEAVKRVSHLTGANLRAAKDYVDAIVTGSEEPSG